MKIISYLIILAIVVTTLGVLTIIWFLSTVSQLLDIEIPWYVYVFLCLYFILKTVRVKFREEI